MNVPVRRWVLPGVFALGVGLAAMESTGAPAAAEPAGVTVAVVPARYTVLQVGNDLANRHGVVLVSYQGEAKTEKPAVHAWTGVEWIPVSLDDFRSGAFLRKKAERMVLVGTEQDVPEVLADSTSWCPSVLNISGLDTASLVTGFGRILNFAPAEWTWFAKRYNLKLEDARSREQLKSWYEQPLQQTDSAPALVRWIRGIGRGDPKPKVDIRKSEEPAPVPVIDESSAKAPEEPMPEPVPPVVDVPAPGEKGIK